MTTEKKVEEIKTDETKKVEEVISKVQVTEKKYTEDEVSAIVSKRLNKEKIKLEEANKKVLTTSERLEEMEKTIQNQVTEKKINDKLIAEEKENVRESMIDLIIFDKVRDGYEEDMKILLSNKIDTETSKEEIIKAIDAISLKIPGLTKGKTDGSTILRGVELDVKKITEEEKEEKEKEITFVSNTGTEFTENKTTELGKQILKTLA